MLTALAALLLWFGSDALLILFAGVLAAVLLRALADALADRTALSRSYALVAVTLALLAAAVVFGALVAPEVAAQVDELEERAPDVVNSVSNGFTHYRWGVAFMEQATAQLQESAGELAARALTMLKAAIQGLAYLFFVGLLGGYLAAEADRYKGGVAALFPQDLEVTVREILAKTGHTLRWWLVGQAVSMTVLGVVSYVGFLLFDIPLALLLSLITALLTFIPNIGPVLAAIPPLLLAIPQGPWTLLYLALFLLTLQVSEGSFLTPMVQRQAVNMPPALLLSIQILTSALLGFWGLVVAAPLAAAGMVLVKEIYIKRILGKGCAAQAAPTPAIRPTVEPDRIRSSPNTPAHV